MSSKLFVTIVAMMMLGSLTLCGAPDCIISCTHEQIVAPLGTAGEIGVRIQQRDGDVQTSSMDCYEIVGAGVQILDQTGWEPIGEGAYEKWIVVSLSEVGEGALIFRNTLAQEGGGGEDIRILPIRVLTPVISGRWAHAMAGLYPLDWEPNEEIHSVLGIPAYEDGILRIGEVTCTWPLDPSRVAESETDTRLFYIEREGNAVPLLVAGDAFFYRCDQLMHDASQLEDPS